MFIEQKTLEDFKKDASGRELVKITHVVYLFEGQVPNEKNLSLETQDYYKKLFIKQEKASLEAGRPVSIMEILNPL